MTETNEDFDLIWIDIETTGLDPAYDHILEIAAAFSRSDKPFEYQHFFHEVLPFPTTYVHSLDPTVLEIHGKSGLLRESLCLRSGKDSKGVVEEAVDKLRIDLLKMGSSPKVLAGSTVHFDRSFLSRGCPAFGSSSQILSHRHYDVSSIKLFCQSLGMPKIPKGEAHRAKADIEESVAHAKQCSDWLVGLKELLHRPIPDPDPEGNFRLVGGKK